MCSRRTFSAETFASAEKHAELFALLSAYEAFLASNTRGDSATVFEEATQHPDWCPIQAADCWTEQPDVLWSPLQRKLVDAIPAERIVPAPLELPGLKAPRRLASAPVTRRPPSAQEPLAFLTQPDCAGPSPKSQA